MKIRTRLLLRLAPVFFGTYVVILGVLLLSLIAFERNNLRVAGDELVSQERERAAEVADTFFDLLDHMLAYRKAQGAPLLPSLEESAAGVDLTFYAADGGYLVGKFQEPIVRDAASSSGFKKAINDLVLSNRTRNRYEWRNEEAWISFHFRWFPEAEVIGVYAVPASSGEVRLGYIEDASTDLFWVTFEAGTVLSLLGLGVFAAVTFFVANRMILRPVGRVVHRINRLKEGDYKPVEFEATDEEFVSIFDSLNQLGAKAAQDLDEISAQMDEIRGLNETLETRVEKRTAELAQKNESLALSLENLELAQERLLRSEGIASMGRLVSRLSHELNTPLGVILTAASFLRTRVDLPENEDELRSQAREALDLILKNTRRSTDLVASFKKVSVDFYEGVDGKIVLVDFLSNLIRAVRGDFQNLTHAIQVDCPEGLTIRASSTALSEIFTSLIVNSHVHGFDKRPEGMIGIEVYYDERDIHVSYWDNGKGIQPDILGKVFEPFFTTRRRQGSLGLGLGIVHTLVEAKLGGTIRLESVPGEGVQVFIDIPRAMRS